MSTTLPGAKKPEPRCPKCDFRTRVIPNPYYGAGLAVHRYLRTCRRCDWTVIVKERPSNPAPVSEVQESRKPEVVRRGIWQRIRFN